MKAFGRKKKKSGRTVEALFGMLQYPVVVGVEKSLVIGLDERYHG